MHDSLVVLADDLGPSVTVAIDTTVYDLVAIFKATYWWTNGCYVYLRRSEEAPNHVLVELRPKEEIGTEALQVLAGEFCNNLIDHQLRQAVLTETKDARDRILQKAFSEGRQHGDPKVLGGPMPSIQ